MSGYHTTCRCPEKIRKILEMPCKHGIYEARWGQGESAKTKKSTMFPQHWDIRTIIEKILEAYLNPIKVEDKILGTCIYGKTTDEIAIKIWINNKKIITAYPEFKIGFFPCCP